MLFILPVSVKMKSCLESLEALEVEIVPAFNALFKEKSAHNENFSYLLKNYWLHQADSLKNLLYLVIDPFAFTLVMYFNFTSTAYINHIYFLGSL